MDVKPYAVRFDISNQWHMSTVDADTIQARAHARRRLRAWGRGVWRDAILQGAKRVDRFCMLVAIGGRHDSPVLSCETLKPLVDAGTDMGLWEDDNPFHRVATLYISDPTPAPVGRTRISICIIPLDADDLMPGFVVSRVPGAMAAPVCLTVPDEDWLTSNMRLPVRERQARQTRVMRHTAPLWEGKALGEDCAVMCGVRYPDSRARWVGDPDNTAETATAMWGAGVAARMVSYRPSLFGFYLLDGQAAPHSHDMGLLAFTVPHGFDWTTALLNA